MEVKHHLTLYLTSPTAAVIDSVQGDGVRLMSCRLNAGGEPWPVPDGVRAGVSYTLPDKSEGYYDELQDGKPAASISGNLVNVVLDPVLTQQPGLVCMSIVLRDGPQQLATFPVRMRVAPAPGRVTGDSLPVQAHGFDGKIYYGGPGGALIPLGLGDGVSVETREDGTLWLTSEGDGFGEDADELQEAIDTALAQAKASGEFDGEDGYSPVRGEDYWTADDIAEIKGYVDEVILGGAW